MGSLVYKNTEMYGLLGVKDSELDEFLIAKKH